MHLFRSCGAHHADDLAAGCAAHDRVVNQHDALAFEYMAHWVELQPDAEVAHSLLRLDEGASDIVVANQPEPERNPALVREAHGCGHTRVGNGHDDVCVHRRLQCKMASHGIATFLHGASKNH